jgi:hypothetical protein
MSTATMNKSVKLSKESLEVLKNFSSINSNILIQPGNSLSTISPVKNVLAEAKIAETFPIQFGLWDLNRFLGVVTLFDDPEFVFEDKFVTIYGKNSSVKFYYSEPKLLSVPPAKKIQMPADTVAFELKQKDFSDLMKMSATLQLSDISVRSTSEGKIEMVVVDKKGASNDCGSIVLGDNESGNEFCAYLKAENLKLIPGDYSVVIGGTTVASFSSKNRYLTYWVALEIESKFGA